MSTRSPIPFQSREELPISQGQRKRRNLPAWMRQLPTLNFPSQPDPKFQLIDLVGLEEVLKGTDPEVVRRIKEDLSFLDYEVMRLFRQRDHEAKKQQNRYRSYQIAFVMLSVVAALLGVFIVISLFRFPGTLPVLAFTEAIIALLLTYLATISGREPPLRLWFTNRGRAEMLRREYFRYLMNMPPYDEFEGYQRQLELSKRVANVNRGVYPEEPSALL